MPKAYPSGDWQQTSGQLPRQFICGYCSNKIASAVGYTTHTGNSKLYICPHCSGPTYFTPIEQVPGVAAGNDVQHVPEQLNQLYTEARQCCSVNAFTAAVLACRKLLMNIAVQKKAEAGKPFITYVEYLAEKGYVPPDGKGWVDHIRKKGNEATHEIALMKKEDAEELIAFAEMLLKFVYEFPARVPTAAPAQTFAKL